MTHALKTWLSYYDAVVKGKKTFELRKMDRPFSVGDTLLLQEYNEDDKHYTGNEVSFEISYILSDAEKFGLKKRLLHTWFTRKNSIQLGKIISTNKIKTV